MDLFKLVGRILIENQEANEEIDKTTEKAKGLGDALGGTGDGANKAGQQIGSSGKFGSAAVWMGNMFTKITEKAIGLGKFVGKTGFGFNANIEAYRNQFTSMLGDAELAYQLVEDIKNLAKDTPLGTEGLVINTTSLLGAGVAVDDMIEKLIMLGNISRGDQNVMNSVTKAYRDVMGKQKLMAQEMYQFTEAGVNIVKLLTDYGGQRYADGSWYSEMVKNPQKFTVPFEDLNNAMMKATAEGGMYHDYMYNMMDTWLGQTDRLGEEGKETLGELMLPFFELAKSDVLPRLTESMEKFGTWISENQETLQKLAEAVSQFVTGGFDKIISAFTWMVENSEATKLALMGIATAMTIGAIAAHPYAAAIVAVAAGLAWLTSEEGKRKMKSDHFFDGHDQEALEALQKWVEAKRALKEADDTYQMNVSDEEYDALVDAADEAAQKVNALDSSLIGLYNEWRSNQENPFDYLDVPLQVSEDSEANMQAEIDGMSMEGVVKMLADTSGLQAAIDATGLTAYVDMKYSGTGSVDGSHANGLDFVPRDGYLARLHYGESVLTRSQADAWRNGSFGGDTSRLEGMFGQMIDLMRQFVSSNPGGQQIVLDSGVLVGQLAPALDTKLGTISGRKGRRN